MTKPSIINLIDCNDFFLYDFYYKGIQYHTRINKSEINQTNTIESIVHAFQDLKIKDYESKQIDPLDSSVICKELIASLLKHYNLFDVLEIIINVVSESQDYTYVSDVFEDINNNLINHFKDK